MYLLLSVCIVAILSILFLKGEKNLKLIAILSWCCLLIAIVMKIEGV